MNKIKPSDLRGMKFGRLSILGEPEKRNGIDYWLCLCECGQRKWISKYHLLDGSIKSCGCFRSETTRSTRFNDLTGQRFGRLVVDHQVDNIGKRVAYLCKCDCGREKIFVAERLKDLFSCGCSGKRDFEVIKRKNGHHSTAESCAYILYKDYQHNAELRGKSFSLDFEKFKIITSSPCMYCGSEPSMVKKGTKNGEDYIYNGIDRLRNDRGYELDNCAPCCLTCNRAKNDMSMLDFFRWIHRLVDFRNTHTISAKQAA